MRICLILPIFLTAVSPLHAQDTSVQQNSISRDETDFQLLAGVEHVEGDVGEGLDYKTSFATAGVAMTRCAPASCTVCARCPRAWSTRTAALSPSAWTHAS